MITTHNQQAPGEHNAPDYVASPKDTALTPTNVIKSCILPPALQSLTPVDIHAPQAGINPMVDAAGYLFTVMGQLKFAQHIPNLEQLHHELTEEIKSYQSAAKLHHYNAEYTQVGVYVMCAALDDMINKTYWGRNEQWQPYSLLNTFKQDPNHQEKFFSIMEYAIKDPAYYIDLMELMYICLSLGYTGNYQETEQDQIQLEQITNSLYKYIRAYRGNISKTLSPPPLRAPRSTANNPQVDAASHWNVLMFTACIILVLFIGLGYLMEMISNEAISNFADIQKTVASHHLQQ